MPLPIPSLDDREFEDLLEELRALIPRYNRQWTHYNPSDPGITLLELFTWIGDQVLYRIDQVPEENFIAFLKLIGVELSEDETLPDGIKRALSIVNERYRAVTDEDFDVIARAHIATLEEGLEGRVLIVNNVNLEVAPENPQTFEDVAAPGHVTIIVVPRGPDGSIYVESGEPPQPTDALLTELKTLLLERRLITTRLHVVKPQYHDIGLEAFVQFVPNSDPVTVNDELVAGLKAFFDPLTGGPAGTGWPVGRSLYLSEYFQILESVEGVDHVVRVRVRDEGVEVQGDVEILPWELISLSPEPVIIQVED